MKLGYHKDRINPLLEGKHYKIEPITVHFSPTLRCNHNCYFCTYGKIKENYDNTEMKLEDAIMYLRKLHKMGVKGVIFTGGGDPCTHKDLLPMLQECGSLGLDFSLNTNGLGLSPELSEEVLKLNPAYVRLSINAGNRKTQKLMTGKDDFERVLANFEALVRNKVKLGSTSSIAVAYVVGIVNYLDIENLLERIKQIETNVSRSMGVSPPIDITIRPIYNYEGSKSYDPNTIKDIKSFLHERSPQDEEVFEKFMEDGAQTPQRILNKAVEIMENIIVKLKKENSSIKIYYPLEKFKALGTVDVKPYKRCLGCLYYAFVWPDGTLYPCVEHAGEKNYVIGNLKLNTAREIFMYRREAVVKWINREAMSKHCAPICAYHEVNKYLNDIANKNVEYKPAAGKPFLNVNFI
jgi:radical SAM protein with 4Fe4S-binding SPASM domain